jgi:hypothetical protein
MTVLDEWADLAGDITDDDILALLPEERAALLGFLRKQLDQWTFAAPGMRNERALLAEALLPHVDWMMAGGSAGMGKTELGLKHLYELSLNNDNHRSLILRTSKPELRRSIVMRAIARFRQLNVDARLRSRDNVLSFDFPNGSVIEFGYCAREEDIGQYLSAEYQALFMDESTQFTESMILQIIGRLRTTVGTNLRPHALLATNPGDRSHAWHYDTFVGPTDYGHWILVLDVADGLENARVARMIETPEKAEDVDSSFSVPIESEDELAICFVPAKATDNPYLDKGYRKYLSALPELRRRQLRDGDWDTYSGQYFAEWNRDIHVVPPFEIPANWQRARGLDFGYSAPFGCVWIAWDHDGNAWVYREAYEAKLTPAQQARAVLDLSVRETDDGRQVPERYSATVADPSVFTNTGAGDPIAIQWRSSGLHVVRANNDRISGWATVREYLRVDPASGLPRLRIFNTCTNLVRTMPLMQFDKRRTEDLDTTLDDHLADCLRYGLMTRPRGVAKPRPHDSPGQQGAMERVLRNLARTGRRR